MRSLRPRTSNWSKKLSVSSVWVVLRDDADLRAVVVEVFLDGMAVVELDRADRGDHRGGEGAEHEGLAGAGGAEHADERIGGDSEVDVLDEGAAVAHEADVLEKD